MKTNDIRAKFLKFFEEKGHQVVPSSSLLPDNDPTLLFTNAGMNQFKDVFTGQAKRPYSRATTCQKCVRAGGKHNDLENVGFTARHHTFFEMLGNFSFGDYFKEEAIAYAWEFLTDIMKFDPEKLSITVFREDDEAENIWHKKMNVPKSRISRCDEADNFWAMGDTGPCGPCSEIHYDQGPGHPERHLEIWNLVFMQFNRDASGKMQPLPKPSIDTGMGLERLAVVAGGFPSNYEIDIIRNIMTCAAKMAKTTYGAQKDADVSLRVIADHSRASAFLVADGVIPGNEGAGYVLRRIMRRAIRHGKKLGLHQPFLFKTALEVATLMQAAYPELEQKRESIEKIVRIEEEHFAETLDSGLGQYKEAREKYKKSGKIPGDIVFKLYDTYGFPVDLTETMAAEDGLKIDGDGFTQLMNAQRERSQKAREASGKAYPVENNPNLITLQTFSPKTKFAGYEHTALESRVLKILDTHFAPLGKIKAGQEGVIITAETPFYAESGGQVGDTGTISGSGFTFDVENTVKPIADLYFHFGKMRQGEMGEQSKITLTVDVLRRKKLKLNHSATHLVHAALRSVLGKHVQQKGSLVTPERLRFDFSHFESITPDQLKTIEDLCNEHVRQNHPVETQVMDQQAAMKTGAMALFGEKYGDKVRVVRMGEFSVELCGGTHVGATGEIGLLAFRGESGVASGVRRVEAFTGEDSIAYFRSYQDHLHAVAQKLKSPSNFREVEQKLEKILAQQKKLEQELSQLRKKGAGQGSSPSGNWQDSVQTIKGIKVLTLTLTDVDTKDLRGIADRYRDQLKSGVVVLACTHDDKVTLLVAVTKDLTEKVSAGNLVREMAKAVGGSGGGRPDFAQAGGSQPENLPKALAMIEGLL